MPLPENWSQWKDTVEVGRYDARWEALAAAGRNVHGEADLVAAYSPGSVLDGGCGTGRVGIELARRGIVVVGVDPDPDMIAAATAKAPELRWIRCGLEDLDITDRFDVVVLAGNVIPYARERAGVVAGSARHLAPGGRLIAGFSLQVGWPGLDEYDAWCAAAGLVAEDRFATWDREPYTGGGYAVSVSRKPR
ncbi:class I SAM-dependent methyltransferase [Pseudonocardia kujensis]|uniref:class I SAM-dependent methyltransferase n=1 Tax=Pseudonocardia kujensis TaxID=1128675 RepID=UPI001E37CA2E|nr:class I SAM-dependent methyltransferase [Pseudonocardia kujensis]MCE0766292.1 class I SAM-dependent methyltransferase [Pseudonocardia kujensis]